MVTSTIAAGSAALPRNPSSGTSGSASDTAAAAEARKPARVMPIWMVDRNWFGSRASLATSRPARLPLQPLQLALPQRHQGHLAAREHGVDQHQQQDQPDLGPGRLHRRTSLSDGGDAPLDRRSRGHLQGSVARRNLTGEHSLVHPIGQHRSSWRGKSGRLALGGCCWRAAMTWTSGRLNQEVWVRPMTAMRWAASALPSSAGTAAWRRRSKVRVWPRRRQLGRTSARTTTPTRGEDAADLADPGRQVRPVPQGQGGDDQVEHLVGERQALGPAVDVADGQPGGGDCAGGRHHLPGKVDTDELGGRVARSCLAQEPAGAAADIKDPPRVGHQLKGKPQGGLVDGDEQVLLQRVVLVAARPSVEPGGRGGHGWSAVQGALGRSNRAPLRRLSSRWPLSSSSTEASGPAVEVQPHSQRVRQGRPDPEVR